MEYKRSHMVVNGFTVSYDEYGEGDVPVIFIHGFPFDKTMWRPQLDHLKGRYRVIAYDIRGFGRSSPGNERVSISLFADDLVKLMDAFQIDKAVVCGLSMGGYILLNAVSRYPNRFKAIILSDTQCAADSEEGKANRQKTIGQVQTTGVKVFAEGFVGKVFCKESLDSKKSLIDETKKVILATSSEIITGALAALAEREETCSSLKKISVSALILCGAEDALTPPALSELLRDQIPGAQMHLIKGAGHLSNLEQPLEFNRRVSDFIAGLIK